MREKINKIIEYGLYLLVFLLPIQARWIIKAGELNGGYSEYLAISLYGTDILLILLIMLFAISKKETRFPNWRLPKWKLSFLVAGLELMVFISIFFADNKLIAGYNYVRFLLGIGLFWLIINVNYHKIKLIYSFLAGIFLQASFGVWQFLAQSSFACKWLGMAQHKAGDLGTSVVETISSVDGISERWLRAYGGMDHPNMLGGLLVVGILIVIWLLLKRNCNKFLIFNYLLLSIFFMGLFFTFSRGAWLGLIVGMLTMFFIALVEKNKFAQKRILEIVLIVGVLIFVLFNQYSDLVLTRVSQNSRLEIKSNTERIDLYKDSLGIIKNNWLFGVGVGNYVLPMQKIDNNQQSWHYQPVHNVFLLIWAEIGMIGLLFFILMPLFIIHNSLFQNNLRNKNLNIKMAMLAALFVMFLVDHWWWSLHFGILLFWLVLGLILQEDKKN